MDKEILWVGRARDEIREFPDEAREKAGFELRLVQMGEDPTDWKPIKSVGAGTIEIRIRTEDGAFRVFYVAKFADRVYVLHAFQKKGRKTSKRDIEIGRARYKRMREDLES